MNISKGKKKKAKIHYHALQILPEMLKKAVFVSQGM